VASAQRCRHKRSYRACRRCCGYECIRSKASDLGEMASLRRAHRNGSSEAWSRMSSSNMARQAAALGGVVRESFEGIGHSNAISANGR